MRNSGMNMQVVVPLTPVVKILMIANVAVWLLLTVIFENYFLAPGTLNRWFGIVPAFVVQKFFIWQIFTYMFFHALNLSHILFNMLLLWWLGSELESRWGSKFFAYFYLGSGVGAGIIYLLGITIYQLFVGANLAWVTPVVGASGAVFGLLLAYGIIFGERIVYFFLVFPMKAKYFVMILAAIEFATLLNSGVSSGSQAANLAHLGGLIAGYLILYFWTRWSVGRRGSAKSSHRRNLKLVVNNETDKNKDPKFWN